MENLNEAASQMKQASSQIQSGKVSRGQQSQDSGQQSLDQAIKDLEEADQARAKNPEQDQKELDELAKAQEALREETKALAESMKSLSPKASEQSQQASESMGQAQQALKRNDPGEASDQEQEAIEKLDEAQKELDREKGEYVGLQQEEVLFFLKNEVEKLIKEQEDINGETARIANERKESGRLSRANKRGLLKLGRRQKSSFDKMDSMHKAISEEQGDSESMAFVWVMEQISSRMDRVSGWLNKRSTDRIVLFEEEQVMEGLGELLQTLKDEIEARKNMKPSPPSDGEPQPPSNGKPPLVSTLAEMLLIRRLQLRWNKENDRFWAGDPQFGDNAEVTDVEMLRQLAHRQNSIRKLFERLMQNMKVSPDGEDQGEGK